MSIDPYDFINIPVVLTYHWYVNYTAYLCICQIIPAKYLQNLIRTLNCMKLIIFDKIALLKRKVYIAVTVSDNKR